MWKNRPFKTIVTWLLGILMTSLLYNIDKNLQEPKIYLCIKFGFSDPDCVEEVCRQESVCILYLLD